MTCMNLGINIINNELIPALPVQTFEEQYVRVHLKLKDVHSVRYYNSVQYLLKNIIYCFVCFLNQVNLEQFLFKEGYTFSCISPPPSPHLLQKKLIHSIKKTWLKHIFFFVSIKAFKEHFFFWGGEGEKHFC